MCIQVYIRDTNVIYQVRETTTHAHTPIQTAGLTREKAIRASPTIKTMLGGAAKGIGKGIIEFEEKDITVSGATAVLKWMATLDFVNLTPFKLQTAKIKTFDEMIFSYQATNTLCIHRFIRGDEIRDSIIAYINSKVLSVHDFSLIVERAGFDKGLVSRAMNNIMFKLENGGEKAVPEIVEIKDFCEKAGVWEDMLAVGQSIKEKKKERGAKAAELAKGKAAKKFDHDFPKLC